MRFGTYHFFQAPPQLRHRDIIHNELEQAQWAEELGFDSVWLTEHTALGGWPMLNSMLRGNLVPIAANRDIYVEALRKAGRSELDIKELLSKWGVSRHIYVASTDAKAREEAKDHELWYQEAFRRFVRDTLAFGSPDTVAAKIEEMRAIGIGEILCWMSFGGLPQDKVRRSMELFAREVMPRFR